MTHEMPFLCGEITLLLAIGNYLIVTQQSRIGLNSWGNSKHQNKEI